MESEQFSKKTADVIKLKVHLEKKKELNSSSNLSKKIFGILIIMPLKICSLDLSGMLPWELASAG